MQLRVRRDEQSVRHKNREEKAMREEEKKIETFRECGSSREMNYTESLKEKFLVCDRSFGPRTISCCNFR